MELYAHLVTNCHKEKCPAWNHKCTRCQRRGHFESACKSRRPKTENIAQKQQDAQFEAELGAVYSRHAVLLRDTKSKSYILSLDELIPHMVDINGQLEVAKPEPQPKININIQVGVLAYQQFGLQSKLGKQFTNHKERLLQPPKVSMVTDTGVQVDCLSKDKRRCLGLNESSFLKTELSLGCANESDAG